MRRRPSWAACAVLLLAASLLCVSPAAGVAPRHKRSALLSSHREAGKRVLEDQSAAEIAEAQERAEARQLDSAYYAGAAALRSALRVLEADLHANATVITAKKNSTSAVASENATANATSRHQMRKANLTAELANLQAVYDSLKKGIVRGNKHEKEGAIEDAKNIEIVEARIKSGQTELNSTNASKFRRELIVNRTRADMAELKYWKSHRGSSHGVFHAHLKMAHGMMDRIKEVSEVYEAVLAGGKVDNKKLKQASWGLPAKKPIALTQQSTGGTPEEVATKPAKGAGQPAGVAPVKR